MDKSRHLQEVVNMIAEVKEGGGEVKVGWVKVLRTHSTKGRESGNRVYSYNKTTFLEQ